MKKSNVKVERIKLTLSQIRWYCMIQMQPLICIPDDVWCLKNWRYFWPISGVVSAGDSDDYHILAASECRDSWDKVSSPKYQQCFLTRECNTQPRSGLQCTKSLLPSHWRYFLPHLRSCVCRWQRGLYPGCQWVQRFLRQRQRPHSLWCFNAS